ncbi:methyltransferase-like protein 25B [Penaeus chinensis]|uniref:methyltransferase-like protein 25B n=1 Tax=Penaeus chinensis TaxID=139456 RepID=UPI001FB5C9D4|nr:methyltransferase-like protein 25B [Penaeus chinensis]
MSNYVCLRHDNVETWKDFTRNAIKLLDLYRHLLDTYVLDFFTRDLWSKLNPSWREVLDTITSRNLADFLSNNKTFSQQKVWPLSLLALRASCSAYTLPRKPVTSAEPFTGYIKQQGFTQETPETVDNEIASTTEDQTGLTVSLHPLQQITVNWGTANNELSAAAGQNMLLQHVFRRHLKPKKQHEVARLSLVAGLVARSTCDGVMVDVGSGQGHLSRLLAYGHDVRVVCLEAEDEFIMGAKKFDNQLELAAEKMKKKFTSLPELPPSPRHTVCHLEPDMSHEAFKEAVTGAWPGLEGRGGVCGLLGLHTCGNLAPTMLRIFTNMPTCHAVVSVGCCYMKLDTVSDEAEYPGYPMSKAVQTVAGYELSYEAREVACHAIEMYVERLHLGADNLKVHCYRAALEEIIVKYWPELRHAGLRSVNHAHEMEFPVYAKAATTRLNDVIVPEEDLTSETTNHNLSRWMQVVVYYSMRLLLAPVIESVVLMDRLLYLYEKGVESVLVPAFDPQLSPRNHVLVAIKQKNSS